MIVFHIAYRASAYQQFTYQQEKSKEWFSCLIVAWLSGQNYVDACGAHPVGRTPFWLVCGLLTVTAGQGMLYSIVFLNSPFVFRSWRRWTASSIAVVEGYMSESIVLKSVTIMPRRSHSSFVLDRRSSLSYRQQLKQPPKRRSTSGSGKIAAAGTNPVDGSGLEKLGARSPGVTTRKASADVDNEDGGGSTFRTKAGDCNRSSPKIHDANTSVSNRSNDNSSTSWSSSNQNLGSTRRSLMDGGQTRVVRVREMAVQRPTTIKFI